jgi:hypothetical protein
MNPQRIIPAGSGLSARPVTMTIDDADGGYARERSLGANPPLTGFVYFWLKYVSAFNPRVHCARCLAGPYSQRVKKDMPLGARVTLDEAQAPLLYLCGVTSRWLTNLHIAMLPKLGARIVKRTYHNLVVTIEDAEELPIPGLADGFRGLPRAFTSCRNYQFGVAYLEPHQQSAAEGARR